MLHLDQFIGAGLLSEPQTAAGIVSFLQIRPFYVKKKKKSFLFLIFSTTIFWRFSHPIFIHKKRLKSLNHIYRYLRTAYGLVVKTTMKDWKNWLLKYGLEIR